jgi:DNA-binding XRE family transcriptional regulator
LELILQKEVHRLKSQIEFNQQIKEKMNSLKHFREKLLLSKAELARKAGISTLTIDRVEKGKSCRMETKRKIILALGLRLSEREKIFGDGH